MTDLLMLIAACAGSLAFGVLAAYAILRAGFGLMRPRRRQVMAKASVEVARAS